jgi:hypothetical protein
LDFAISVQFPSHGLILRKLKNDTSDIIKGITKWEDLKKSFHLMIEKFNSVYAETDMRTMYNPSRMTVIENAAKKLVDKVNSYCPQCNIPGFGVTNVKKGLECSLCGSPTEAALSFIYICIKCNFKKEDIYPHNKTAEDPTYCDYCNP